MIFTPTRKLKLSNISHSDVAKHFLSGSMNFGQKMERCKQLFASYPLLNFKFPRPNAMVSLVIVLKEILEVRVTLVF